MTFGNFKISPQTLGLVLGAVALIMVVLWIFKLRHIQHLKAEIAQLETELMKGQELSKKFPPLTEKEKKELQKARERLLQMLPKEKDVPSLLQELGRLARDYHLMDVSFKTDDRAVSGPTPVGDPPRAVVAQTVPPAVPVVSESSGSVGSFPVKVAFSGDYREIAYFLHELQQIPRLVTVQSVQLKRGVPFLGGEIQLHAYYQIGELPVLRK